MVSKVIHALHGFLGKPTDWNFLGNNTVAHDILKVSIPHKSMWEWANRFNQESKGVLLGYSLGGRLAMHALLQRPDLWWAAIIVSAHPKLLSNREERLKSDEEWAMRFESEPWDSLIEAWNGNDVFCNAESPFERKERDYSRSELADILRYWSLAHQEDLSDQISQLNIPILWVAGENDSRYAAQAKEMKLRHPNSKIWISPQTGHRVPWESQKLFCEQLNFFLEKLIV